MRKKDITLREFIHVYITTHGSSGYGERLATRAKHLVEVIYGQPEVLDALQKHPAPATAGIGTTKARRFHFKAQHVFLLCKFVLNHGLPHQLICGRNQAVVDHWIIISPARSRRGAKVDGFEPQVFPHVSEPLLDGRLLPY